MVKQSYLVMYVCRNAVLSVVHARYSIKMPQGIYIIIREAKYKLNKIDIYTFELS